MLTRVSHEVYEESGEVSRHQFPSTSSFDNASSANADRGENSDTCRFRAVCFLRSGGVY